MEVNTLILRSQKISFNEALAINALLNFQEIIGRKYVKNENIKNENNDIESNKNKSDTENNNIKNNYNKNNNTDNIKKENDYTKNDIENNVMIPKNNKTQIFNGQNTENNMVAENTFKNEIITHKKRKYIKKLFESNILGDRSKFTKICMKKLQNNVEKILNKRNVNACWEHRRKHQRCDLTCPLRLENLCR